MAGFTKKQLQRIGESMVSALLTEAGCTILERNFATKFAELDIIAIYGRKLVVVEVRTRTFTTNMTPDLLFSRSKQHRIRRSISIFRRSRTEYSHLQLSLRYYLVLYGQQQQSFKIIKVLPEQIT